MSVSEFTGTEHELGSGHGGRIGDAGQAGHIEIVAIADLHIDRTYQRELSNDLVEKIARGWSYATAGPIRVSRRENGDLYIVNGQHRTAAAHRAGKTHVLAQVIDGLDRKSEATLRLQGNVKRTDSIYERFRAQLGAEDAESLAISEIAERFGTKINSSPIAEEGINAIATVEAIYRLDRGVTLSDVFALMQDVWGTPGGRIASSASLRGIAWLLSKHGAEVDRRRLVAKLQTKGYAGLVRATQSHRALRGGGGWINFYRACLEAYNDRLPEESRVKEATGGWSKTFGATGGSGYNGETSSGGGLGGGGLARALDRIENKYPARPEADPDRDGGEEGGDETP